MNEMEILVDEFKMDWPPDTRSVEHIPYTLTLPVTILPSRGVCVLDSLTVCHGDGSVETSLEPTGPMVQEEFTFYSESSRDVSA